MRDGKLIAPAAWLAGAGLVDAALADATFYSDSINDLPLLEAVGLPVAVDPDPRLAPKRRGAAGRCSPRLIARAARAGQDAARQTSDAPLASSSIQIARAAWRGGKRRCRWLPMK